MSTPGLNININKIPSKNSSKIDQLTTTASNYDFPSTPSMIDNKNFTLVQPKSQFSTWKKRKYFKNRTILLHWKILLETNYLDRLLQNWKDHEAGAKKDYKKFVATKDQISKTFSRLRQVNKIIENDDLGDDNFHVIFPF